MEYVKTTAIPWILTVKIVYLLFVLFLALTLVNHSGRTDASIVISSDPLSKMPRILERRPACPPVTADDLWRRILLTPSPGGFGAAFLSPVDQKVGRYNEDEEENSKNDYNVEEINRDVHRTRRTASENKNKNSSLSRILASQTASGTNDKTELKQFSYRDSNVDSNNSNLTPTSETSVWDNAPSSEPQTVSQLVTQSQNSETFLDTPKGEKSKSDTPTHKRRKHLKRTSKKLTSEERKQKKAQRQKERRAERQAKKRAERERRKQSTKLRHSGGSTTSQQGLPSQSAWHCRMETVWQRMPPGYFPRYIQTGRCTQTQCMMGLYECVPKRYFVKVLRRIEDECLPLPNVGATSQYEEAWHLEDVEVIVGCDCSKRRDAGKYFVELITSQKSTEVS